MMHVFFITVNALGDIMDRIQKQRMCVVNNKELLAKLYIIILRRRLLWLCDLKMVCTTVL